MPVFGGELTSLFLKLSLIGSNSQAYALPLWEEMAPDGKTQYYTQTLDTGCKSSLHCNRSLPLRAHTAGKGMRHKLSVTSIVLLLTVTEAIRSVLGSFSSLCRWVSLIQVCKLSVYGNSYLSSLVYPYSAIANCCCENVSVLSST